MPNQTWGRKQNSFWPRRGFVHTAGALAFCILLFGTMAYLRFTFGLTDLQKLYLPIYVRTAALSGTIPNSSYSLLIIANKKGQGHPALEDDLAPGITQVSPATTVPFVPSEQARSNGLVQIFLERKRPYQNTLLYQYLKYWMYQQRTLLDLFAPAFWGSLGIFAVALFYTLPKDIKRRRELRYGRRLRGPESLSPRQFRKRSPQDGIAFPIIEKTSVTSLAIPRQIEDSHILIMGDNGSGKSTLIRQILLQVCDRGESAIVYDPALEYVTQFHHPKRGDVILNPLDERMPFWSPGDELLHPSEATAIAESLFPQHDHENPFFVEGPSKIFAHLLSYRPSPHELAEWMSNPEEIERRLRGTELASFVNPRAPAQRGGILASLSMVGDALKCLPRREQTQGSWTAAQWAKQRRGWIFITSKPILRKKLRPLISLWLDLLGLRLMSKPRGTANRVWFVLDELASLQKLPQLHTAITENRKSGNPLVLGFHGRSQLEARYGREAEAMLSQPATKIFLRTSEERAAEWVSKMIGEVETERLRESHHHGGRDGKDFSLEPPRKDPVVMASEIMGLENLHGYLKLGNFVTSFQFPYISLPSIAGGFIPRKDDTGFPEMPPSAPRNPLPETADDSEMEEEAEEQAEMRD